jgi:2,4-dienoyl-CoA reductase-like NADH-dependent reductase (Old Yellow Enzyme family)
MLVVMDISLCGVFSPIKSPISPFKPRQMSEKNILETIDDYARCASLSKRQAMMV